MSYLILTSPQGVEWTPEELHPYPLGSLLLFLVPFLGFHVPLCNACICDSLLRATLPPKCLRVYILLVWPLGNVMPVPVGQVSCPSHSMVSPGAEAGTYLV